MTSIYGDKFKDKNVIVVKDGDLGMTGLAIEQTFGCNVLSTEYIYGAKQAIRNLAAGGKKPDLFILDQELRGGDTGQAMIDLLKQPGSSYSDVPALIITGAYTDNNEYRGVPISSVGDFSMKQGKPLHEFILAGLEKTILPELPSPNKSHCERIDKARYKNIELQRMALPEGNPKSVHDDYDDYYRQTIEAQRKLHTKSPSLER